MSGKEKTRANNFDRRMGLIQTKKSIEMGVAGSILDIGCGVGEYTPMFLDKFKRVVGLDPSEEALKEAREAGWCVEYVFGWGETFSLNERFDTISMTNLLEHVDDPVALLKNCKKHLAGGGRIIAQVPNSESITRRLGVIMKVIDSLDNISEKERKFFGHQRVYTLKSLENDALKAGLQILWSGGLLYKPLPNDMLEQICVKRGEEWAEKFINALVEFGKDKPTECGYLYIVCE